VWQKLIDTKDKKDLNFILNMPKAWPALDGQLKNERYKQTTYL
jgi:hypothetical protein